MKLFGDVYMYKLDVEWRGIFTSSDEEPLEGYMVGREGFYRDYRLSFYISIHPHNRSLHSEWIDNVPKL